MTNNFSLGVVTVTRNCLSSLRLTAKSILEQNYDEWLIIDSLSTDGTYEFASNLKNVYPLIKVVHEKDNGIYEAMNKAFVLSSTSHLIFMNSGDMFHDNSTCDLIKNSITSNNSIVYGDTIIQSMNPPYRKKYLKSLSLSRNNLLVFSTRVLCHQSIAIPNLSMFKFDTSFKYKAELCQFLYISDLPPDLFPIIKTNSIISIYQVGGQSYTNFWSAFYERLVISFQYCRKPSDFFLLCVGAAVNLYSFARQAIFLQSG